MANYSVTVDVAEDIFNITSVSEPEVAVTVGDIGGDITVEVQEVAGPPGPTGPQGPTGATGATGPQGASWQEEFETVSKNLKSWDAALNYTGSTLNSIVYTSGADTITKTFGYTGAQLTTIVLSGDTPSGISLTKTFGYTGSALTSVSYT